MPIKKTMPQPHQTPLFEMPPANREYQSYRPWTEYGEAVKVAMVTHPEKGAHVNIEARDQALLEVIRHLGHSSMLGGLEQAIHTPRRAELQNRYKQELPHVLSNAESKRRQEDIDARGEFREAFGYSQLVPQLGALATSELFVDTYDSFLDTYYGPSGNAARGRLRKRITKNQAVTAEGRHARRAAQRAANKKASG